MAVANKKRVIVVGGGLAGLACTIKLAELGVEVDLFSMVPVKRSHSVCAQGGINACNDIARQQGFSEWEHFEETMLGGDFLADQPPVLEMANWAPKIIDLLDRMGVPFNRTPEGQRDLRLFGGSLFKRTFFAGATTGQQLLYALDEQTRRWESEGRVNKYEFWEFLWPVIHDGRCVGIVAQDMRTMQIKAFRADAVVMATGGNGLIFGKSTMSVICTGGAASRCYQAGRKARQSGDGAGSSHRHSRRRQMPAHLRIRPRRRRASLGAAKAKRHAQPQLHPRSRTLLFPRRAISQIRQHRPARHRHARNLRSLPAGPRHRRRKYGLSGPAR